MKIVAVTSCPTGIAHTYMAAEALEKAATQRGHTIDVETQGSAGVERFAHLPVVEVPVARAINRSAEIIEEAEQAEERAPVGAATSSASAAGGVATTFAGGPDALYILAILIGTAVTAVGVLALKRVGAAVTPEAARA